MNVGELRRALADIPDDLEVMFYWPDEDHHCSITSARVEVYDPFGSRLRARIPGLPPPPSIVMIR